MSVSEPRFSVEEMVDALREERDELEKLRGSSNALELGAAADWMLDARAQLAERDRMIAALRDVLQQAHDADAFHEWFTDTEEDGVDVAAVLAYSAVIAREYEALIRAEEWHAFNDAMNEFTENMKADRPAARATLKKRMLSALALAEPDGEPDAGKPE